MAENLLLALEDGRIFTGEAFGSFGEVTAEVCFNTSMTGYQEIITDPSYRGQMVALTQPHIGNYGINELDMENSHAQISALIVEDICHNPSNFRSVQSLPQFLAEQGVVGISGVDTRALTRHLRAKGAMRAAICPASKGEDFTIKLAQNSPSMLGRDLVVETGAKSAYRWDMAGLQSPNWRVPTAENASYFEDLVAPQFHIIAYDYGIKTNILRSLRQAGMAVSLVPPQTPAAEVLAADPDGVFFSNGPGDPAALEYAHQIIADILGKKPVFAICLGHQLIAHAIGAKTYKMKFGHRGGNQPVQDLRTGKIDITAQNHGFAVDAASLPAGVVLTHRNLNDGSVEGFADWERKFFAVQHHPEAAPGPNDAKHFFSEFVELLQAEKNL